MDLLEENNRQASLSAGIGAPGVGRKARAGRAEGGRGTHLHRGLEEPPGRVNEKYT